MRYAKSIKKHILQTYKTLCVVLYSICCALSTVIQDRLLTSSKKHVCKTISRSDSKRKQNAAHKVKSDGRSLTKFIGIISLLSLTAGYAVWSFSVIAKQVTDLNNQSVKSEYSKTINSMHQTQLDKLKECIDEYNRHLALTQIQDPFMFYNHHVSNEYKQMQKNMDLSVMGQLSVPSVEIDEPIYFSRGGSSPGQNIEHVASTSIPNDLLGTNAVLAGHSGQAESVAFDRLDQVKNDDIVSIKILDRKLNYRVTSINTVNADEVEVLKTHEEISQLTLLTCWPKYLNTKRLIVRCTLISSDILNSTNDKSDKTVYRPMYFLVLSSLFLLSGALAFAIRQFISVVHSNHISLLKMIVTYLIIIGSLWLFMFWVLGGLLAGDAVVGYDIGYSWFNSHIFRLFVV